MSLCVNDGREEVVRGGRQSVRRRRTHTHFDAPGGVVANVNIEEDDGAGDALWCVERSHGEC